MFRFQLKITRQTKNQEFLSAGEVNKEVMNILETSETI